MWTLRDGNKEARTRVLSRPLSDLEGSFYWDGVLNGTADSITHLTVQLQQKHSHTVTKEDYQEAWLALKRRFPILVGRVDEHDNGESLEFVVDEHRLSTCWDGEITFVEGGEDAAQTVVNAALNSTRRLSSSLLSSVAIVRPAADSEVTNLVFTAAHVLVDGMANFNIGRAFLDFLTSPSQRDSYWPDLEERLHMAQSASSLAPPLKFSPARIRWRRAVARILWDRVQEGLQGGHGLLRRDVAHSATTPAISRTETIDMSPAATKRILDTCRSQGITFGHAYSVLAQLAMSRILHRQHFQGIISEDEWQSRIRQPTHTGGPFNLRSFLRKDWVDNGGQNELNVHISFYFISLPHMPYASRKFADHTGAPPFSTLMSHDRFLLRCKGVKKDMNKYMGRPLFFEVIDQQAKPYKEGKMANVMIWRKREAGEKMPEDEAQRKSDYMRYAHGGSSLGQVR